MSIAEEQKATAQSRAERGIIELLLEQHTQIRQLIAQVNATKGADRQMTFDRLRELLAIHEAGEEIVLRPVSEKVAGEKVAASRNQEESEASTVLAELEKLDVDSAEFERTFAAFAKDVDEHAQHEEHEEFPRVRTGCSEKEQLEMGRRFLKAEEKAPTHPHPGAAGSPGAQKVLGPFAALMDKAKDAYSDSKKDK